MHQTLADLAGSSLHLELGGDLLQKFGPPLLAEEGKPPPLAADDAEDEPPAIDPDLLDAIESKLDGLAGRMDRLERTKRAEQALLALEDEIERRYPPSNDDDDDDMALKPRRH